MKLSRLSVSDGFVQKLKRCGVGLQRSYTIAHRQGGSFRFKAGSMDREPIHLLLNRSIHCLTAPSRGANGKPIVFKRTDWEPEEVV